MVLYHKIVKKSIQYIRTYRMHTLPRYTITKIARTDSLATSCLRGNRNNFGALSLPKSTWFRTRYLLSGMRTRPRYAITKIYKNSLGQKLHFYDFCNCVFSYWPCVSLWGTLADPCAPEIKNKHPNTGVCFLSWLWAAGKTRTK